MKQCINKVSIIGTQEKIRSISKRFEKNFSMSSLVPLEVNENSPHEDIVLDKVYFWGCEQDIDVQTYIYCNFEPYRIDMSYITDIPNTTFLRRVSDEGVDINHSFYSEEEGYVGSNTISYGEVTEEEYSEEENSSDFKRIAINLGFVDKEEPVVKNSGQVIISMKDLLEIKNRS